mmetsp:Transcript_19156/g.37869  ORF Transcript_19156/g.37869 Transcript_19156/m.37869 type:complete len:347 (-) Transcript_19156:2068-3108(-)
MANQIGVKNHFGRKRAFAADFGTQLRVKLRIVRIRLKAGPVSQCPILCRGPVWRRATFVNESGAFLQERLRRLLLTQREAIANISSVESRLGKGVSPSNFQLHWVDMVTCMSVPVLTLRVTSPLLPIKPCPRTSERIHMVLRVSGNRFTLSIALERAVFVQLPQSNGKQLHQFAGEVFVRLGVSKHNALVLNISQVLPHHRIECDLSDDVSEVAKSVANKNIHPRRPSIHRLPLVDLILRQREHLGHCPSGTHAELVGIFYHGVVEQVSFALVRVVRIICLQSFIPKTEIVSETVVRSELRNIHDFPRRSAGLRSIVSWKKNGTNVRSHLCGLQFGGKALKGNGVA